MDPLPPQEPNASEVILTQETCLYLSGPLGYVGEVTLSDRRIVFRPTSSVDKMIGAGSVEVDLNDITEGKFGGIRQVLSLTYGDDENMRFNGAGARRVWLRLSALLFELKVPGGSKGFFDPNERVLVTGTLNQSLAGMLGAEGEATLTDRRFHFSPGRGPERFFWPGRVKEFAIPVEAIEDAHVTGLGRRLHLTGQGNTHQFTGADVPKFFSSLSSLGVTDTERDDGGAVVGSWEGMRYKGPLASPGVMAINSKSIHFQPTRRLDMAVGIAAIDLRFDDLHEMRCGGWPEKRLEITTSEGSATFGMDGLIERFMDIVPSVVSCATLADGDLESARDVRLENVERALGTRFSSLDLSTGEKIRALSVATRWVAPIHLVRGWLVLTDQQLFFAPFMMDLEVESFSVDLTLPPPIDEFNPDELLFEYGGAIHRFAPHSASQFTASFWTLMSRGSQDNEWRKKWGTQFKDLIGDIPSLDVLIEGEVVAKLRPAITVAHSYGFGVVFPGTPGPELGAGADVELVVSSAGGRFGFHGTIVKQESYKIPGAGRDELQLLVIAHTPILAVANRRQYFRVPLDDSVALMPLEDPRVRRKGKRPRPIYAVFKNISVGGCALYCARDLGPGTQVHILLPTPYLKLRVLAQVMRSRRAKHGPHEWFHRVQFIHRSEKQREAVGDRVMQVQRERLLLQEGLADHMIERDPGES